MLARMVAIADNAGNGRGISDHLRHLRNPRLNVLADAWLPVAERAERNTEHRGKFFLRQAEPGPDNARVVAHQLGNARGFHRAFADDKIVTFWADHGAGEIRIIRCELVE